MLLTMTLKTSQKPDARTIAYYRLENRYAVLELSLIAAPVQRTIHPTFQPSFVQL